MPAAICNCGALALEQITGEPFAGLSHLSDTALMPRLSPDDQDSWVAQAEAHDYMVQLKQIDRRIAQFEVEKARARNLPVVNLTASHTPAGAASGYARPTTTTTAMLSVTIPFSRVARRTRSSTKRGHSRTRRGKNCSAQLE